jgi:hypothetical protein
MKATKEKVIARLIKNGNNAQDVYKMVEREFDHAMKATSTQTTKHIAMMIRINY